jgi:hypothetical protein
MARKKRFEEATVSRFRAGTFAAIRAGLSR